MDRDSKFVNSPDKLKGLGPIRSPDQPDTSHYAPLEPRLSRLYILSQSEIGSKMG